jgi:hypothetical protein
VAGQGPDSAPPDPWADSLAAVTSWEGFVDRLRQLHESADRPSYRAIERASRRTQHHIGRQTAQNLLSGKTRAEEHSLVGFLHGCKLPSSRHEPWKRTYHRLRPPARERATGTPPGQTSDGTTPQLAAPGHFPPVTRRFVPRPELEGAVWEALVRPVPAGSARTVAVVGMTGVGKSTLARAVGHSSLVTEHFPDGALWIDIGPEGDTSATTWQAQILERCGRSGVVRDQASGRQAVRAALAGRRLLIVLDDVWSADQVRSLLPPDAGSTLLITSRNEEALFFDTERIRAEPLDAGPDVQLVLAYADTGSDATPAPALARVTRACAGLPLALAVAGSLVGEATRHWGFATEDAWEDVADRLERSGVTSLGARFQDYPHPTLWVALDASVASLSEAERDRFTELAALNGHGWVPVAAVRRLWRREECGVSECRDLLSTFARRALLDHDPATGRVRLHSLVQEYLDRVSDPAALRASHLRIATSYLADWGGAAAGLPDLVDGPTERDPDTGYGLRRVIHHLLNADALDLAAEVITSEATPGVGQNVWLTVREGSGQFAEYLDDLARVAEAAAARTDADLAAGRSADWLVVELTCAALHASLVGQAANLPGPMLAALVRRGGWTVERALGYARRMPDPEQRATALICLLPEAPERDRPPLALEALEHVHTLSLLGPALTALVALAPWLPGPLDDEIPWILSRAVPGDTSGLRLRCTAALTPHLSPEFVAAEIEWATTICVQRRGSYLLAESDITGFVTAVAPYAPPGSHDALLRTARTPTIPYQRLLTLAAVHDVLPADGRQHVLDDMVGTVLSREGLTTTPEPVLSRLPDDRRVALARELLAAARTLDDPAERLTCLSSLVDTLRDEVNLEINAVFGSWPEPHWSLAAYLMDHLDETQRQRVLDEVLKEPRGLLPTRREQILVSLAPYAADDLLARAVDEISQVRDLGERFHRLVQIADHLPATLRTRSYERFLRGLAGHPDSYGRVRALRQFAPVLPDELTEPALDVLTESSPSKDVDEVLALLSPRLTAGQLDRVLALVVRPVQDDAAFTRAVTRLATHLPTTEAQAVARRVFEVAAHSGPYVVGRVLPQLSALLPLDDLPQGLARLSQALPGASQTVITLAGRLRAQDVEAVLTFARGIQDEQDRAYALAALAREAPVADPTALYREALHAAAVPSYSAYMDTDYGDGYERNDADLRCLVELAREAPDAVLPDVVDLAVADPGRAEMIAVTWDRLDARQRAAWWQVVESSRRRLDLSIALLPHLSEPERVDLAGEVLDALRPAPSEQDYTGSAERKRLLAALLPVTPPQLVEQARSIAARVLSPEELLGGLPDLSDQDRAELSRTALTMLAEHRWLTSNNKAWAIHRLAPHLSPAALPQALRLVAELDDGYDRQQALTGLTPHLPAELVPTAHDIAVGISNSRVRVDALVVLSRVMSDADRRSALRDLLDQDNPDIRASALGGMAPYLPPDQISKALAALRHTQGSRHHSLAVAKFVDMFADPASRNHQPRWNDNWRALLATATVDRRSYFFFLGNAAGAIRRSLDDAGVLRLVDAMEDVRRWLP